MRNQSIEKAFAEIDEQIKDEVREATVGLSKVAVNQLVKRSPIWQGDYINAHRISIDGSAVKRFTYKFDVPHMDIEFEKNLAAGILPPQMPLLQQTAEREKVKKDLKAQTTKTKAFSQVMLLNRIHHAPIVEYVGWVHTRAYGVYRRTRQYLLGLTVNALTKAHSDGI